MASEIGNKELLRAAADFLQILDVQQFPGRLDVDDIKVTAPLHVPQSYALAPFISIADNIGGSPLVLLTLWDTLNEPTLVGRDGKVIALGIEIFKIGGEAAASEVRLDLRYSLATDGVNHLAPIISLDPWTVTSTDTYNRTWAMGSWSTRASTTFGSAANPFPFLPAGQALRLDLTRLDGDFAADTFLTTRGLLLHWPRGQTLP